MDEARRTYVPLVSGWNCDHRMVAETAEAKPEPTHARSGRPLAWVAVLVLAGLALALSSAGWALVRLELSDGSHNGSPLAGRILWILVGSLPLICAVTVLTWARRQRFSWLVSVALTSWLTFGIAMIPAVCYGMATVI